MGVLSRFVLWHKLAVVLFWLLVLAAGAAARLGSQLPALDATIVRALLVPALVAVLGEWNWRLPRWARWLPRLPGPPPAAAAPAACRPASASTRSGGAQR